MSTPTYFFSAFGIIFFFSPSQDAQRVREGYPSMHLTICLLHTLYRTLFNNYTNHVIIYNTVDIRGATAKSR